MKKLFLLNPMSTSIVLTCLFFLSLSFSVEAKKPNRWQKNGMKKNSGTYNEHKADFSHPLTMFDKTKPGFNAVNEINSLIGNIQGNNFGYRPIYLEIYNTAEGSTTASDGRKRPVDEAAKIAKCAAFVFLIALDKNLTSPPGGGDPYLPNIQNTGTHTAFGQKARDLLMNLNPEVKGALDDQMWRSKELIMYLQAFDILKAAEDQRQFFFDDDYEELIKQKLQLFARNLFRKANNPGRAFSKHNNHTLTVAGALGLASIVLHDCGYRKGQKEWHPREWAQAANVMIEQTFFTNRGLLDGAMSETDGKGGYAEGPHYFMFSMENLIPFFRAYMNMITEVQPRLYVYKDRLAFVTNHLADERYQNLMEWYISILHPDGTAPSFDATYVGEGFYYILASWGKYAYMVHDPIDKGKIQGHIDYLASGIIALPPLGKEAKYSSTSSGDLILRTPFSLNLSNDNNGHYLRVGGERGRGLNGGGHEHADATAFSLYSGTFSLALDPGYLGYQARGLINDGDDHNVITVNGKGPKKETEGFVYEIEDLGGDIFSARVDATYHSTYINRVAKMYNVNGRYFFFIQDKVNPKDWQWGFPNDDYAFNLNGNGLREYGSCSNNHYPDFSMVRWTHPCQAFPNRLSAWNLQSFTATEGGGGSFYTWSIDSTKSWFLDHVHGGDENEIHSITYARRLQISWLWRSSTKDIPVAQHTRFQATKSYGGNNGFIFLTALWPYQCDSTPPQMFKDETAGGTYITIKDITPGMITVTEVASAMVTGPTTITNPQQVTGSTPLLKYESVAASLMMSKIDSIYFKNCLAITKFRATSITEGKFLYYDADTLIKSDSTISTGFKIIGKHRYSGYCRLKQGMPSASVSYYLPDMNQAFEMVAEKSDGTLLTSTYDTSTRIIKITFTENVTQFVIKLANPCLLSCFFPPTNITIDTTFDFNTGTLETLGHDLDIVRSEGNLKITEGSKMSICQDITLANKDSIVMYGVWQVGDDDKYPHRTNYNDQTGQPESSGTYNKHVAQRIGSKKSMIIVNDEAALVLDSGSFTHVGANSTILIRKGGTLIVKDSAVLEIGDINYPGIGEVIAEDGSYVCISMGAKVRFFKHPHDSVDNNVFYISMHPTKGATAGKNPNGANGKFVGPSGIYYNVMCLPLCDIKTLNLFNSVYNKEYGWANINFPEAHWVFKDTFCVDKDVIVRGIPTLHETKYHFQICQYNPTLQTCVGGTSFIPSTVNTTGHWDSIRITEKNLSDHYSFVAGQSYKVMYIIKNDCNEMDTLSKIIYISPLTDALFTLPDSACPGIGSVSANGSASSTGTYHEWIVSEIIQYGDIADDDETVEEYDSTYSITGSVSSNFTFPGFRFKGGKRYEITLRVYNYCGYDEKLDTIRIPLSAKIHLTSSTIYAADSVQLKGRMTGQTSFIWSSSGGFSNTTDTSLKVYVSGTRTVYLIATSYNNCHDTDSVTIKLNIYANAGLDDTICKGDSMLIGINSGSLPTGWTYKWTPSYRLSDSTIRQVWAKPDSTVTYTLSVKNTSGTVVETDEVTVFVDELSMPDFAFYGDTTVPYRYCFRNQTFPYYASNTFEWSFGDGSTTSDSVNPCHLFPNVGIDTFFVICLTVTNTCGDSLYCDTLFLDSLGVIDPMMGEPFMNVQAFKGPSKKISELYEATPNPTGQRTIFNYSLASNTKQARIIIRNSLGVQVKSLYVSKSSTSLEFDFGDLPKGVYYYSLEVDGELISTKKISVQ